MNYSPLVMPINFEVLAGGGNSGSIDTVHQGALATLKSGTTLAFLSHRFSF